MELVNLWHVAEQNVLLAAQSYRKIISHRGVLHFCPVTLIIAGARGSQGRGEMVMQAKEKEKVLIKKVKKYKMTKQVWKPCHLMTTPWIL